MKLNDPKGQMFFSNSQTGISLTLLYSSTNMLKSMWTSGFWKPLVHTNMLQLLEYILCQFYVQNNSGRNYHFLYAYFSYLTTIVVYTRKLCSFTSVDEFILVWTSGFLVLVHLTSGSNSLTKPLTNCPVSSVSSS